MNIDKTALGNRIQLIRKELGKTLKDFGKLVDDADKSLVSRWEKGLTVPNNKRLKIIAELGNLTISELLYGSIEDYLLAQGRFKHLEAADIEILALQRDTKWATIRKNWNNIQEEL